MSLISPLFPEHAVPESLFLVFVNNNKSNIKINKVGIDCLTIYRNDQLEVDIDDNIQLQFKSIKLNANITQISNVGNFLKIKIKHSTYHELKKWLLVVTKISTLS